METNHEMPQSMSLHELTSLIHKTLDNNLGGFYYVTAEIQSLTVNRNGQCYLELIEKAKDGIQLISQIRATIWAGQYRIIKPYFESITKCAFQAGIKILVQCRVQYHEVYGLSINITDIKPEYTVGEMALERQRTIKQLKNDGVFDMNRSLPLPRLLKHIAVISSKGAAGYGDFLNQINNNSYGYTFYTELFEATMQGNQAENSIIEQLDRIACRDNKQFDCVVIIRGGGSKTDLQCFDNYNICQNICQFPLPIITGIGHDRDESVADLVSNLHLKTPTAVAQFLIDKTHECDIAINQKIISITNALRNVYPMKAQQVQNIKSRISAKIELVIQKKSSRVDLAMSNIKNKLNAHISNSMNRINTIELLIDAKNPINILRKGYTYTMLNGKTIKSASEIKKGDQISTIFHDGNVISTV